MAQAQCSNHGLVDAVWKEVTSKKDGKLYKFWSCPKQEKDQFGNYIKCKVEVANTPNGKFEQSLGKAATQMDNSKKDELITRTAIAKELIAKGFTPGIETGKIANAWVDYCFGKSMMNMITTPPPVADDEIQLSEIPF